MNENQPKSACCGAEIGTVRTHGRPFYIGCFSCNNPIPASKGEGWKEALCKAAWDEGHTPISWVQREVFPIVQSAIDEAVEADRKKMNVEAWDAVRALAAKKPDTPLKDCIAKIVPGPNENRIILPPLPTMKPSERIIQIFEETPSKPGFMVNMPVSRTERAILRYLDEEWKETHCEIPPSTEPGKLHDCSKIHVNSSQNAQSQPK